MSRSRCNRRDSFYLMKKIAIVEGVRTPFIKSWGLFDRLPAQWLGAKCVRELLERTRFAPNLVDEVIFGCVAQPAEAANVARVISLESGIPKEKEACTVNRNCASGFEAVTSAAEKILCGVDEVVVAGGTESMSNASMLFRKDASALFRRLSRAKNFLEKVKILLCFRPKHFSPVSSLKLGLTDPTCGLNMGETAEILAKEFKISRERQDAFALRSHERAVQAREKLREEIIPVFLPNNPEAGIQDDNGPREHQTLNTLSKLKPVFDRGHGTVTAGNSSQITDGACALLLMDAEKAKAMGYEILGILRDYTYVGVEPSHMGLGPVFAIEKLLRKNSLTLKDIGLIEINEAFAAQVLACLEALASPEFFRDHFQAGAPAGEIDPEILNVNGGAIALGHPVGTSGARLILTCLKEMKRRSVRRGLVSLCVGGGQGGAVLLER